MLNVKWDLKTAEKFANHLNFSKANGLVVIIAQDWQTNEILMCAFANKNAIIKSLTTGYAHYYSRSRRELWKKGETSGHIQEIKDVFIDCDEDTILFKIKQSVAACHRGYKSCFYRKLSNDGKIESVGKKIFNPSDIY
ncbi:MAG: phosphoribosyl-AMP cyclohydrolase [Promethearchaeota archaeon]